MFLGYVFIFVTKKIRFDSLFVDESYIMITPGLANF